jgi:hypothetical protein
MVRVGIYSARSCRPRARAVAPGSGAGPRRQHGGKPMPQCIAFGANLLLPNTVGDFTNPLRGIIFISHEPGMLALRELLRIIFRHKSQDGLVAVDAHGDRMNDRPFRIPSSVVSTLKGICQPVLSLTSKTPPAVSPAFRVPSQRASCPQPCPRSRRGQEAAAIRSRDFEGCRGNREAELAA